MATYRWPADILPSSCRFFLEPNTAFSTSPLSRVTQAVWRPGARWVCQLEFRNRDSRLAPRIDALLNLLDGPLHLMRLWPFHRPVPRGAAGASATSRFTGPSVFTDGSRFRALPPGMDPTVIAEAGGSLASAAQKGKDRFATGGWADGVVPLLAGDFIGLGWHLYQVMEDVAPVGGSAYLRVRPRLRQDYADGTPLRLYHPTANFRLTDNQQAANPTAPGPLSSYALSWVEDLG